MLRPLAFVTVRQQQCQAADPAPFHFARGDELIYNHLRSVGKVAELRFPCNQLGRLRGGVSVFEPDYRGFR